MAAHERLPCNVRRRSATLARCPGPPSSSWAPGPVGLTAALLLARRGLDGARRREARRALSRCPRAVHLDDEAFRVLQAAGVADEVAARQPAARAGCGCSTARTASLAEFRRGPAAGLNGWPQGSFVHQPDLEARAGRGAPAAGPGVTRSARGRRGRRT